MCSLTSKEKVSEERLRNVRAWAAARPDMSGSAVIVAAIDELLQMREDWQTICEAAEAYSASEPGDAQKLVVSAGRDLLARARSVLFVFTGEDADMGDAAEAAGLVEEINAFLELTPPVPTKSERPPFPWRPIETAPKDGRNIILGHHGYVTEGYRRVDGLHVSHQGDVPLTPFTHWQPMPDAPTPTKSAEDQS